MKALSQLIDKYLNEMAELIQKRDDLADDWSNKEKFITLETEISVLTDVVRDLKKLQEEIE